MQYGEIIVSMHIYGPLSLYLLVSLLLAFGNFPLELKNQMGRSELRAIKKYFLILCEICITHLTLIFF